MHLHEIFNLHRLSSHSFALALQPVYIVFVYRLEYLGPDKIINRDDANTAWLIYPNFLKDRACDSVQIK